MKSPPFQQYQEYTLKFFPEFLILFDWIFNDKLFKIE